ncbi:MAG TPA: DapH/DapD/GlmU-related protein [Chitinophagaceae bacterium]|nr:DapH/DapD/GlmU-related protein [Chitinophagaceae bacterium]
MIYFGAMEDKDVFVHPSSIIDKGAQIGKGTRIWHFCHVASTSKIGERCNIGQNVYIDNNAVIGNDVKIQNNVSVYNGVIVEDGVFLGPSMVFTNVINPRSFIERKNEFKQTLVRKGATIGANATILCGIEIGRYAMIGAGAVVTRSVQPYSIITGNPARHTGWISEAGMKLDFNAQGIAQCTQSGKVYKLENGGVEPAG